MKMRSNCFVFLLLLAFLNSFTIAQKPTVEEVINNHIDALGGREKLESVETIRTRAMMDLPARTGRLTADFAQTQKGDDFVLTMDIERFGRVQRGSKDGVYWTIDPLNGAKLLEGDELLMAKLQHGEQFPALRWNEFDGQISYRGREEIDGRTTHKLEFRPNAGIKAYRYFDAETWMILKVETTQKVSFGEMNVEVYPSDYREIDGIKIPFNQVTSSATGDLVMRVEQLEFDIEINDGTFDLPVDVARLLNDD